MRALHAALFLMILVFCLDSAPALAVYRQAGEEETGAKEPEGVLAHMEASVQLRDFEEFRTVLADSFVYIPDLLTVQMYPEIDWDNWDLQMEENFLRKMLSPVSKAEIFLLKNITERGAPYDGQARYELVYNIVAGGQNFTGKARFVFVEVENRWYLWKWEEIEDVTNPATGTIFTNSGIVRASLGSEKNGSNPSD